MMRLTRMVLTVVAGVALSGAHCNQGCDTGNCDEPAQCSTGVHTENIATQELWDIALPVADALRLVCAYKCNPDANDPNATTAGLYALAEQANCSGTSMITLQAGEPLFLHGNAAKDASGTDCVQVEWRNMVFWAQAAAISDPFIGDVTDSGGKPVKGAKWYYDQLLGAGVKQSSTVPIVDTEGTHPPAWYQFMTDPAIPPPPENELASLEDVLSIATIAAFAVPQAGPLIAAGLSGAEIGLKSAGFGTNVPDTTAKQLEWEQLNINLQKIVDRISDELRQQLVFTAFQSVDSVQETLATYVAASLAPGGNPTIVMGTDLDELQAKLCGTKSCDQINMTSSPYGAVVQAIHALQNMGGLTPTSDATHYAVPPASGAFDSAAAWAAAVSIYLQMAKTLIMLEAYPRTITRQRTVSPATKYWLDSNSQALASCSAAAGTSAAAVGAPAPPDGSTPKDHDVTCGIPAQASTGGLGAVCVKLSCPIGANNAATDVWVAFAATEDAPPIDSAKWKDRTTKEIMQDAVQAGSPIMKQLFDDTIYGLAGGSAAVANIKNPNVPGTMSEMGWINYLEWMQHGARAALAQRFSGVGTCQPFTGVDIDCSYQGQVSGTWSTTGYSVKDTYLQADTDEVCGGGCFATSGWPAGAKNEGQSPKRSSWSGGWEIEWLNSSAQPGSGTFCDPTDPPWAQVGSQDAWQNVASAYAVSVNYQNDGGAACQGWTCNEVGSWCEGDLTAWMVRYVGNRYRTAYAYDAVVGPRTCKKTTLGDGSQWCAEPVQMELIPVDKNTGSRYAAGNLERVRWAWMCSLQTFCAISPYDYDQCHDLQSKTDVDLSQCPGD